ncbi:hypothetical protein ALC60_06674 [Trachymyrmex zeteki]|uniref:HAT C-terminal dimerisation domain-containing protein n=1 Tax=Mycetomoellerius zeteki TaxID=64791 RepID=A0A151X2F9_9HYME|nr:hypothetical protein ALC60_06674 [Trachymyrmex zeteki]
MTLYLNVYIIFSQINTNFQRESAALACRRFKGKHSYDKIAEMIHDIHCEFKLDAKKVVKVTTDNASNMVKAFTMFSQNNQIDLDNNDNDDSDDDFIIQNITEGTTGDTDFMSDIFLPVHQRCASHTINLLITVDIKAALTGPSSGNSGGNYSRSYHSSFGKCSAIWNLTSRSPKAAETYADITGKASSSPCVTRWNSTFDCLNDLMIVKQFLGSVCDALDLPKFKETDFEFLAEYIECVKPIAEALDRLQGEKNCFYGELLPVLLQTQKNLQKLQYRHLKYCAKLVIVLLEGLYKRFSNYFDFSSRVNDAILAAVSHPFFKLRWVPKERKNDVKELLINEAECLKKLNFVPKTRNLINISEVTSTFFSFEGGSSSDESITNTSVKNTIELQCLQYLQDEGTCLDMLNKFPIVKEVFIKYNTALPSSAPVERLFSYGGMIMRPNRRSMHDDIFEKQLLLKANSAFIK